MKAITVKTKKEKKKEKEKRKGRETEREEDQKQQEERRKQTLAISSAFRMTSDCDDSKYMINKSPSSAPSAFSELQKYDDGINYNDWVWH